MAAKKKTNAAFDFVKDRLKRNPRAAYADIKAAADKKKIKGVYPILYGRAQVLLGIVKSSPRGKGKAKRAAAKRAGLTTRRGPGRPPKRAGARRGPGRPRKNPAPFDSLQTLINGLKDVQRDRDRLRATLAKVRDLIDAVG